ncbi:hypothetical protein J6590_040626 [Homalodisca vitripennis]|nr:hypothetical protein J6590_040626 [Homalodisca vitripennis]
MSLWKFRLLLKLAHISRQVQPPSRRAGGGEAEAADLGAGRRTTMSRALCQCCPDVRYALTDTNKGEHITVLKAEETDATAPEQSEAWHKGMTKARGLAICTVRKHCHRRVTSCPNNRCLLSYYSRLGRRTTRVQSLL